MVIKNGKGHSMLGFLGKREQREIKAELEKLKGYQDANNKSFVTAKKQASKKLQQIDAVKANMVQASGGALSSSQQKILEFLTALSIAVSLSQMVEEEIQQLRKLYADMKKLFKKKLGRRPGVWKCVGKTSFRWRSPRRPRCGQC